MTVVLLILAVVLVAVNAVGVIMTGSFASRGAMLSQVVGFAVIGPALLAAIFLVAKSNRTWRRYLGAFCVLSALAAGANLMEVVESTKPKPQQVVRGSAGATLAIPADWRTSERKSESQSIYVVSRLATEAVAVQSVPKAEAGLPFEQFAAALLEQQRTSPGFVGATEPGECPMKAEKCVAYEVRQRSGDTVVVQLMHVLESPAAYHVLVATTNEPLFERSKPRLKAIAASFTPGE